MHAATVGAILERHLDAIQSCAELAFVHVTTEASVDPRLRASNHSVIQIGLRKENQTPSTEVLYLDGVRVFFVGGARVELD